MDKLLSKSLVYIANVRLPTEKAHGLQIMSSCAAFADAGFDVTLLVPTRNNPISEDPFLYYGIRPSFRIVQLPIHDWLEFGRLGFYANQWQFSRAVRIWVSGHQAEREGAILYGRDAVTLAVAASVTGRGAIVEIHDYSKNFIRFLRRRRKYFAGYVTTNEWKRKALIADLAVRPERTISVPNGVEVRAFDHPFDREAILRDFAIDPSERIVAYVGRLYAWKGVQTLLHAAAFLPTGIRVVCVGGSVESARSLAPDADLTRVEFIPQVPHARVPDLLRAVNVLVLPNSAQTHESTHETSPLKLFEYLASGVPIVASDLPSIREIVDESMVLFVPPDDSRALADAIQQILQDPASEERAKRARAHANQFTWDRRAERLSVWFASLQTSLV